MVMESHTDYCGCAIGTAYTGLTGRNLQDDSSHLAGGNSTARFVANAFGVPAGIVIEAEDKHLQCNGAMPRDQIADWLESQGY